VDGPDEVLARAARGGDAEALQTLVRRHYPLVLSLARSALRDGTDAEDAAQETFFKVVRSIGRFAARSRFSTWLHRVARNTVSDHLRRRRTRARLDGPPVPDPAQGTVGSGSAEPSPLLALLAGLPAEERDLLRSVYAEGTPVRRVAERLGLAPGAVRWRLFRTRRRLRAAVRYNGTGGPP